MRTLDAMAQLRLAELRRATQEHVHERALARSAEAGPLRRDGRPSDQAPVSRARPARDAEPVAGGIGPRTCGPSPDGGPVTRPA